MSEQVAVQSRSKWRRLQALAQNPITVKELRSRMRGRRAFVVLTVYLLGMSGIIALVYLAYASSSSGPYGPEPRQAGKAVFAAVLGMQVILVTFIGPAFTAGAISGEKERQTYDLLRTTLLSSRSFVTGKLISALSYVMLLILSGIPLQSIAFMLGGVSPLELLISQLLIVVAAVTFALYGLFCSSTMRTTLASSVSTFAGALFVTLGIPTIALLFTAFLGPLLFGSGSYGWMAETLLTYAGLVLAATNLPASLIVGELFLIEENALFFFKTSMSGHSVWLFSPWPFFLLLYSLLALILYWASVRRVKRIAEK